MIVGGLPEEHPGTAAEQVGLDDSRGLQGAPGDLQSECLLGVDPGRLTGRDPEEAGVPAVQLVQEASHLAPVASEPAEVTSV